MGKSGHRGLCVCPGTSAAQRSRDAGSEMHRNADTAAAMDGWRGRSAAAGVPAGWSCQ